MKPVDLLSDEWQGHAIAYSGYRDGQSPDSGVRPSQDQVAEDLRILARNWRLIRVYAADRHGEDVLEVIRREKIDLKVMLGIWLGREPGAEQEQRAADRRRHPSRQRIRRRRGGRERRQRGSDRMDGPSGARGAGDPLRARGQGGCDPARDRGGQLRLVARPRSRIGARGRLHHDAHLSAVGAEGHRRGPVVHGRELRGRPRRPSRPDHRHRRGGLGHLHRGQPARSARRGRAEAATLLRGADGLGPGERGHRVLLRGLRRALEGNRNRGTLGTVHGRSQGQAGDAEAVPGADARRSDLAELSRTDRGRRSGHRGRAARRSCRG